MTHDDETVERVARAIIGARFAGDEDGSGDMPTTDYDRDLARAALSALPERAFIVTPGGIGEPSTIQPADNRELLREALSALQVFAKEGDEWSPNFNDTQGFSTKPMPNYEAGDLPFAPAFTMGDLRRARAAADKIRAALGGEKQT